MRDPFKIDGPTAISFSGGRTSAYMLWRVLQANSGKLPNGVEVCFANTGKEAEETLRFVRDVGQNWNVPIRWVEYRADEPGYALVDFDTASRDGEPFAALIAKRNYLPNPVTRFCTVELKIRAMHKHLKVLGWKDGDGWDQMVGIRADEPRRVAKIRARPSPETNLETMVMPLADAGITKKDVGDFWRVQPFDLGLRNDNGTTPEGNCDLCFLKGANRVFTLIKAKPERAIWWAKQEALALALSSKPSGASFRSGVAFFAGVHRAAAVVSQFSTMDGVAPAKTGTGASGGDGLTDERIELIWARHADTAESGKRRVAFARAIAAHISGQGGEDAKMGVVREAVTGYYRALAARQHGASR